MREIASRRPGTGACTLATAMQLWVWTLEHLQKATDADGRDLYHGNRQGVTFPLADALCWLLAARYMILDVLELEAKGTENPVVAEGLTGRLNFMTDLCHVQSTRAAGEVGRICAELVFGYNRHPAWDNAACAACYAADDLDALEGFIPGIASGARGFSDVIGNRPGPPDKGRSLRAVRRLRDIRALARETGWLSHRLPPRERPRGGSTHESDDPGGIGLSRVTSSQNP